MKDEQPTIDPLHRVFVPIEKRTASGDWRFRTTDNTRYTRHHPTGQIVHADPQPSRSKKERRRRRQQQREA